MKLSEISVLFGVIASFDRRTTGESDVRAWHAVLGNLTFETARDAVFAHYTAETRWIMPADIIKGVRKTRTDAAVDIVGPGMPAELPDADPDDPAAYLAALREQRTRAADGDRLKPRPVAELLEGAVKIVDSLAAVSHPSQLPERLTGIGRRSVPCPRCKAAVGRPCKKGGTPLGKPQNWVHHERRVLSEGRDPDAEREDDAQRAEEILSRSRKWLDRNDDEDQGQDAEATG